MSQYSFRKPTIGQHMDLTVAAAKGDTPAFVRLLGDLAVDDILDLPFFELGPVVQDFTSAMRAWEEQRVESALPDGMVDFLANLLGEEDKDG